MVQRFARCATWNKETSDNGLSCLFVYTITSPVIVLTFVSVAPPTSVKEELMPGEAMEYP